MNTLPTEADQPALPVVIVAAFLRRESAHAAYTTNVFKDANGKHWQHESACFWFDLKPADEDFVLASTEKGG